MSTQPTSVQSNVCDPICGCRFEIGGKSFEVILYTMTSRELSTRTGFQISLECECGFFLVELDDHERSPRAATSRMRRETFVVRIEAQSEIGGHADVVLRISAEALEHIDDSS